METLKQALDREHGLTPVPWRRFHHLLAAMSDNWARLAFARRHWYHNKTEALTLRYTHEELANWDDQHEDEDEEPEGWDKSSVAGLAVDAGGRVVTGGDDGCVHVWDAHGRLLGSYSDEWNWNHISCVCQNEQVVVAGYMNRPVESKAGILVWDFATGEQKHSFSCTDEVRDLAMRAPFLVAGCDDVMCWDLNTGAVVQRIECGYPMSQVELHPTEYYMLLTGSIYRNKVWVWDVRTPKKYVAKAALGENLAPPFAFDAERLVAGEVEEIGEGGAVRLWDMRKLAKPLFTLHQPTNLGESTGDVYAVEFNSEVIVSSHEVGGLRLWSMTDGALIGEEDSLPLLRRIVIDREEGRCFAGGDDGGIYFVDIHKEAQAAREWCIRQDGENTTTRRARLQRSIQHLSVVEPPVANGGPLDFADVNGLQVTKRGLAATFRDSSVRFYDFAPAPRQTN